MDVKEEEEIHILSIARVRRHFHESFQVLLLVKQGSEARMKSCRGCVFAKSRR